MSHQLGLQLSRKPIIVYRHWLSVIQPLLTRYSGPGDCLEVDYKSVLINYMARNDLQYGQDVRWSDLVTRSEFEGETTPTIIVIIMTSLFSSRNHSHVSPKTLRQGRHLEQSPAVLQSGGQNSHLGVPVITVISTGCLPFFLFELNYC